MFCFSDFSVEQNAQLIFSGQGSEIICANVTVTDDGVYEGDESYCIALQSSDPDITIGPLRETCITIVDNDCKLSLSTRCEMILSISCTLSGNFSFYSWLSIITLHYI